MDKEKIKQAEDNLYSPSAPTITHAHKDVDSVSLPQEEEELLSTKWSTSVPVKKGTTINTQKINTVLKKVLLGALIFFGVSLVASILIYFYGNNIISARNITIQVSALPSSPSSNPFSFDVSVQNGNNAGLVSSDIIIDYPDGARSVDDDTKTLVSEKIEVGSIGKGEIIKKTASVRLFGKENDVKKIKLTFEYKLAGSAGTFSKSSSFDVTLRQAPVTLSVDALKEVNNNQQITLTAKVSSNSNDALTDVVLDVVYPFGFTYTSSNLEVETGSKGQFPVGSLAPNETKEVIINGTISGQSAEDKIFKFNVGTADTSLVTYNHNMVVRSDFLATAISFDGGTKISAGDAVRGTISWKNTLTVPLNDVQFSLHIQSNLINPQLINVDNGYYNSLNSTIVWDKTTNSTLGTIAPGQTGTLSFLVPTLSYTEAIAKRITNPKIDFSLNLKAKRLTDTSVTEDITSSFVSTLPILSSVTVGSHSLYSSGQIKNTGRIPPQAEKKTTYTAVISLSNSLNNISSGEVVATLPVYVSFENETIPSSEKVTWNEEQHKLRWDVGSLSSRTGYGTSPRTLSFKVGIIPSKTQIGNSPTLVRNITFTGQDDFAGKTITATADDITTYTKDPGFVFGDDRVVQ